MKRNWKFFNFFNKIRNFRRKRQIFASTVLVGNLLFGNVKLTNLKINKIPLNHQKLISNEEFNSFNGSHNSGKIIRTGKGTILEFQHQIYYTSSNDVDEIILVKDDGIVPGADGFSLNNNYRKRHPFSKPRMRGRGIDVNIDLPQRGLGTIPEPLKFKSFMELNTDLNARHGNRGDQCPAPEFDMKKQYKNFMQQMSQKGYELEYSQERFTQLSTNPQTGSPDEKSLIEAKGGLQGDAQGIYTNIRRPNNKAVDLDFEIDNCKNYTHLDLKTPIDFQNLADKKKIDVSNFPSLETVAYNIGKKIPSQKEEFRGLPGGPKSPDNVLHVVNLELIRDFNQKQNMIDRVLTRIEKNSDNLNSVGIYFLNYL